MSNQKLEKYNQHTPEEFDFIDTNAVKTYNMSVKIKKT